jgi:thiol-disulfide isomerase/thioredoxin
MLVGCLVLPGFLVPFVPAAKSQAAATESLTPGQPVELVGPTLEGGRYDLAEHRGKVVVVDFWATWCRPCVAELPNVQKVYEEYHERGLEIVSVSLDRDRSKLVGFLKDRPLPWPQVFFDPSDPASARNHPAVRYNVEYIPYTLVIDRDGNLRDQNVRGDELRQAVARSLGESVTVSLGARIEKALDGLVMATIKSILLAPWWLMLACSFGGAVVVGLAWRGLDQLFRRRAQPAPAAS